jgi:hypothetical protein
MKSFLLFAILIVAIPVEAQNHYYTTTFPLTENPICENAGAGCVWLNGKTTGLNWGNVQTIPGMATGTIVNGAPPYNDSSAVVNGTWTTNQTVQATVKINSSPTDGSSQEEVELRLNTTITPNSITGYEADASVLAGNVYLVWARWNGPLNSYCYIHNGTCDSSPTIAAVQVHNGDVLTATNVNGQLTMYLNGVAETTAFDTTFTGGYPGMGFWNIGGTAADLLNYGLSKFTAWDSAYTGVKPGAPTNVAGKWVIK